MMANLHNAFKHDMPLIYHHKKRSTEPTHPLLLIKWLAPSGKSPWGNFLWRLLTGFINFILPTINEQMCLALITNSYFLTKSVL